MKENPFWEYSILVYARPGVESLLLELQDDKGADVNMLLASCWLADGGYELSQPLMRRAVTAIASWRRECVQPLMGVRRFLENVPTHAQFREQVKQLELEAEQIQQEQLFELLSEDVSAVVDQPFEQLAMVNLQVYLSSLPGVEWGDVAESATTLVKLSSLKNP